MGFIVWIVVGIITAAAIRVVAGTQRRASWRPNTTVALLGAIAGGYFADLVYRGDSVANFRGPTVIGALVGALLFLAVAYLVDRLASSGRRAV